MKGKLLFAVACCSFVNCIAQPVLNDAMRLYNGTHFTNYKIPPTPGIVSGPSGASVNWNFSALVLDPGDTTYNEVVNPSSTPFGAQFPAATHVAISGNSSFAVYQDHNDTLKLLALVPNPTLFVTYTNPFSMLRRPVSYLDQLSDVSTRFFTVNGETFYGQANTTTVVDGWGTLTVGSQNYSNVLRVKITQLSTDSSNLNNLLTTSRLVSYLWFNDQYSNPLLRMDSVSVTGPSVNHTEVSFEALKNEVLINSVSGPAQSGLRAYYNGGTIIVTAPGAGDNMLSLQVFDAMGREVFSKDRVQGPGSAGVRIPLDNLVPGQIYFSRISLEGKEASASTIRFVY